MIEQLSLSVLPVADPAFERAVLADQLLERTLAAVSTVLDHDEQSAPSTRILAEHLLGEHPEDQVTVGGPRFVRMARMLTELQRRGLVFCERGDPGYAGRDDERVVTRWMSYAPREFPVR